MHKAQLTAPIDKSTPVSATQRLVLLLARRARLGLTSPHQVVKNLMDNRELWRAVMLGRSAYTGGWNQLVPLRDLPMDTWNMNTIYIWSSGVDDARLSQMAQAWKPNAQNWIVGGRAESMLGASCNGLDSILELWWD